MAEWNGATGCESDKRQSRKQTVMRLKGIITTLILMASLAGFAPPMFAQTSEAKQAEMREKIGLDMTVPDFDTKKIDSKVMGTRLAGILDYLMENYQQGVYECCK